MAAMVVAVQTIPMRTEMIKGNEEDFYERIRVSASRINRRSLRRFDWGDSQEQETSNVRKQEVPGFSGFDEKEVTYKTTPEVLVVSRALRDHGLAHIEGMPTDEYDCCAAVAIEAYEEFKTQMMRSRANTIVSSLLNDTGEPTYGRS